MWVADRIPLSTDTAVRVVAILRSSGTVAFTIITLLPVELILKVSKGAGFSMVFALLVAAILWQFGDAARRFIERRLTLATSLFAVALVGGFVALRYL